MSLIETDFANEIAEKALKDFLATNPTDEQILGKYQRLRQELDELAQSKKETYNLLELAAQNLCSKLHERISQK